MPAKATTKPIDKFDEYKFFIDDTARLSERRQGVTSTYISVNSAVIGLIAFLAAQPALQGIKLVLAILPAVAAGIIVCYFWHGLLMTYKKLLGFRFAQLAAIESRITGCHQMYKKENDALYHTKKPENKIEFTKLEARLPFLFGALYLTVFLVILLIAVFSA